MKRREKGILIFGAVLTIFLLSSSVTGVNMNKSNYMDEDIDSKHQWIASDYEEIEDIENLLTTFEEKMKNEGVTSYEMQQTLKKINSFKENRESKIQENTLLKKEIDKEISILEYKLNFINQIKEDCNEKTNEFKPSSTGNTDKYTFYPNKEYCEITHQANAKCIVDTNIETPGKTKGYGTGYIGTTAGDAYGRLFTNLWWQSTFTDNVVGDISFKIDMPIGYTSGFAYCFFNLVAGFEQHYIDGDAYIYNILEDRWIEDEFVDFSGKPLDFIFLEFLQGHCDGKYSPEIPSYQFKYGYSYAIGAMVVQGAENYGFSTIRNEAGWYLNKIIFET